MTRFRGLPVSPGHASGLLRIRPARPSPAAARPRRTRDDVTAAFAAVARSRTALAGRLRAEGRDDEAGIIEIAALIAGDPALAGAAADAVAAGADPETAISETAERHARLMEDLGNPDLAARAADIRQVAAAAIDYFRTDRGSSDVPGGSPFILVARDISPAELIELTDSGAPLAGAVSVSGGATSHAAIIARGLAIPMMAGADPAVLETRPGQRAALDGTSGELAVGATAVPSPAAPASPVTPIPRSGPAVTVLANVASAVETRRALAAGVEGVGLLRTEIPFLESRDWPGYGRQRALLEPILSQLEGKTAVVRLLDFSGDKIPPFLRRDLPSGAGLAALLERPAALTDQLRAILDSAHGARLAILIPMVRDPAEITRVREALAALTSRPPPTGIMVELAGTARRATEFARAADFFSVGTNDLVADVLGLARSDPAAGPGRAGDPRVLDLVRQVAAAGGEAGIDVSVCGDAAADPDVLPELIAAGIRTVSVGAGAVGPVRSLLSQGEP
ncbi:MAG: PEP-utilizing enzyme [Streptosporangiales bacterium]|nr:PEP-utilizing enzyme [Streptosporangiales bacterium]